MVSARIRFPGDDRDLTRVDVALVMESTYPFLKGGVSAVVHDIICHNPDITFGIIHTTWDSGSPLNDLYGMPANVLWVDVIYLSLEETRESFGAAMSGRTREKDAERLYHALELGREGDSEPLLSVYDDLVNPLTRKRRLWPALQTKATMERVLSFVGHADDISLGEAFWQVRDFFSLAFALVDRVQPPADVYHAHTTGYASLIAAAGAHQRGGRFLLTEHNLYVRDIVNILLDRPLNLNIDQNAEELARNTKERMWVRWWLRIGKLLYPFAEKSTYLYPQIIDYAEILGSERSRAEVVPNGVVWDKFAPVREARQLVLKDITAKQQWRIACIARVVPIKGILELIDAVASLADRGVDNITVDVLGPTEEIPDYYHQCVAKVAELGLGDRIRFRGTVVIHEELQAYDALILSSFNEGQPIVVLEAMAGGLPVLGTDVGGMTQLVTDPLPDSSGVDIGPCGRLVEAGDGVGLADLMVEMCASPDLYLTWQQNSLDRVRTIFLMPDVMGRYNSLYRELKARASTLTRRDLTSKKRGLLSRAFGGGHRDG